MEVLHNIIKKISKKYYGDNFTGAIACGRFIRTFFGVAVLIVPNNRAKIVVRKLSYKGLFFFILWNSLYICAIFRTYSNDQTILRFFYNTKLKHYGDVFERASSILYVIYFMWKVPFQLSGNTESIKQIVAIDDEITKLGVNIDHSKMAHCAFTAIVVQIVVSGITVVNVLVTLASLNRSMSLDVMFQGVWSDAMAMTVCAFYYNYLINVSDKFDIIHSTCQEITDRNSWEHKVFLRNVPKNLATALKLQDKYVCEKIRTCSKICAMLYKVFGMINISFGLPLTLILITCLLKIILNMFYLMEATASGMYQDTSTYICFSIFIYWRILFLLGVAYIIIGYSDSTTRKAAKTSIYIDELINCDLTPAVTEEAMHLSLQLLHQVPVFKGCGFTIDNELIMEGIRSVTTFLVILLQFVTD